MADNRSARWTEVYETVGPGPLEALNPVRIGRSLPKTSCTDVCRLPDRGTPPLLHPGMAPRDLRWSPIRTRHSQAVPS